MSFFNFELGSYIVFISVLILTGCASSLANKSANEVARHTIRSQWEKPQYNFQGEARLLALEIRNNELISPDLQKWVSEFRKGFSIGMEGAIDVEAGKLEIIPSFQYTQPNLTIKTSIPMQFYSQDYSILLSPSAGKLFYPTLSQYADKFIRLRIPPKITDQLPLKAMLQAIPQLTEEAYGLLDASAFTLEPLDQKAKALNASYKLHIRTNVEQDSQITLHIIKGLFQVIQQKGTTPARIFDENLDDIFLVIQELLTGQAKISNSNTDLYFYLDRQGKPLFYQGYIAFEDEKAKIKVQLDARYSNHAKPIFQYHPTEQDIVDFNDIVQSDHFIKCLLLKDDSCDEDNALPEEKDNTQTEEPESQLEYIPVD